MAILAFPSLSFSRGFNCEPWILAALAIDLAESPVDLSDAEFALEVRNPGGQLVLSATTANKKFFTAAGGVLDSSVAAIQLAGRLGASLMMKTFPTSQWTEGLLRSRASISVAALTGGGN
jgi:hypothetical protein